MALFKTEDLTEDADEEKICEPWNGAERMLIAKRPGRLLHIINELKVCGNLHFISDGDWNLFDLLNAIIPDYRPAELWLSTYALTEFPVRQMLNAINTGDLYSVQMLVDYRSKVRMPAAFQLAANIANKIRLTAVHAKVMVLHNNEKYFTLVGSQNWTENPRIEAGVISTEKNIAEFHLQWLSKKIDDADIFE